jgi:hypothetical protein
VYVQNGLAVEPQIRADEQRNQHRPLRRSQALADRRPADGGDRSERERA